MVNPLGRLGNYLLTQQISRRASARPSFPLENQVIKLSITRLAYIATASLSCISTIAAQSSRPVNETQRAEIAKRIPVTLALVTGSTLQRSTARIQRNREGGGDVVVVRKEDASPQLVADAMFTLMLMHETSGDTAAVATTAIIREGSIPLSLTRGSLRAVDAVLRRVAAKPSASVRGLGNSVQTGTVYLPSRALRQSLKAHGRLRLEPGRRDHRP